MKVYLRGDKIKEFLIRKNKPQSWLAQRFEISTGYMTQLMDGSRCPSPVVRERIMKIMPDQAFDDLFVIKEGENGKRLP